MPAVGRGWAWVVVGPDVASRLWKQHDCFENIEKKGGCRFSTCGILQE